MATIQKIIPNLWYDTQAEEAVKFYTSVFKNSSIIATTYFGKAGQEIHGMKEGMVMTISFELGGQRFLALNGGLYLNSTRPYPSSSIAVRRRRSITSGRNYRMAVMSVRSNAVG